MGARISRAASWLMWDGTALWNMVKGRRRIPAVVERRQLVEAAARSLGYPGGRRLRQLLVSRYYWRGLATDCLRWCREFDPV